MRHKAPEKSALPFLLSVLTSAGTPSARLGRGRPKSPSFDTDRQPAVYSMRRREWMAACVQYAVATALQ
jgi:hypothetical protein